MCFPYHHGNLRGTTPKCHPLSQEMPAWKKRWFTTMIPEIPCPKSLGLMRQRRLRTYLCTHARASLVPIHQGHLTMDAPLLSFLASMFLVMIQSCNWSHEESRFFRGNPMADAFTWYFCGVGSSRICFLTKNGHQDSNYPRNTTTDGEYSVAIMFVSGNYPSFFRKSASKGFPGPLETII